MLSAALTFQRSSSFSLARARFVQHDNETFPRTCVPHKHVQPELVGLRWSSSWVAGGLLCSRQIPYRNIATLLVGRLCFSRSFFIEHYARQFSRSKKKKKNQRDSISQNAFRWPQIRGLPAMPCISLVLDNITFADLAGHLSQVFVIATVKEQRVRCTFLANSPPPPPVSATTPQACAPIPPSLSHSLIALSLSPPPPPPPPPAPLSLSVSLSQSLFSLSLSLSLSLTHTLPL